MDYTEVEKSFLEMTRRSLKAAGKNESCDDKPLKLTAQQRAQVVLRSQNHAVVSFFYDWLYPEDGSTNPDSGCWDSEKSLLQEEAIKTVRQSYRLLYETHKCVQALEQEQIGVAVLKGVAAASFYPVPELRKSGDIDLLLLDTDRLEDAGKILCQSGWKIGEEQLAKHHVAFENPAGIELELHTMLAEPFDERMVNEYLDHLLKTGEISIRRKEIMGVEFPILSDGYHAFELLLHMLQHFLRSGFGLKLLCDWVMFWNRPVEEKQIRIYEKLIGGIGAEGFSDMVTSACIQELGLSENCPLLTGEDPAARLVKTESVKAFVKEILEAEEFGKSENNRMVMLRTTGLSGYIREFHHQMQLHYPRAGRCFPAWPVLWTVTLIRFLQNNRRVRGGIRTREILKKADQRSRVMEDIHLFQRKTDNKRKK